MTLDAPALDPARAAPTPLDALLADLARDHAGIEVLAPSTGTAEYAVDAATRAEIPEVGPAVARPASVDEVRALVRAAGRHGVAIVPRGAGSGLAGGATASTDRLVITTEKLTRVVEVSPLDEVAVVEPGVLNIDLNRHLAPYKLFYAPDPASWDISSVGGNVATNAGGLRCAKYGVTRESILALDVVLADGSLIRTGHRSIKGVTGLDLVSLFVGSEGILGIVVGITVRVRPIPVARLTVTARFPSTEAGVAALGAISLSPVRPSILEFLDAPTLHGIDAHGRAIARPGPPVADGEGSLLLIELDGYGIEEQLADLERVLTGIGGVVTRQSADEADYLWELRRHGRGLPTDHWFVGADIAVPKSQLPALFAHLPVLEERYGLRASAVAHAGDGNLHPSLLLPIPAGADPAVPDPRLHEALDELTRVALSLGGTVSGEHGIGSLKRELAAEELSPRALAAQHAIKAALDPHDLLNPGKAL